MKAIKLGKSGKLEVRRNLGGQNVRFPRDVQGLLSLGHGASDGALPPPALHSPRAERGPNLMETARPAEQRPEQTQRARQSPSRPQDLQQLDPASPGGWRVPCTACVVHTESLPFLSRDGLTVCQKRPDLHSETQLELLEEVKLGVSPCVFTKAPHVITPAQQVLHCSPRVGDVILSGSSAEPAPALVKDSGPVGTVSDLDCIGPTPGLQNLLAEEAGRGCCLWGWLGPHRRRDPLSGRGLRDESVPHSLQALPRLPRAQRMLSPGPPGSEKAGGSSSSWEGAGEWGRMLSQ
ncbi:uncharacterized protein LOC116667822 [Camelus ferus]|uniref:Uncharacterized protein LOC116667822 n=1 Tax=Camelus ferus TaxID=419612 RepID=A0A8B8U637_CAMFR|nr:uncharacterized protein LOC116667822 [Camelus ferus]